jgi:hypothetical protein
MFGRQLRSMSKSMLKAMLVALVLIEIGLGTGLYFSSKSSSAAPTPSATPAPRPCTATSSVLNYPRTVLIGHYETFSVCLKHLPNVILTYTLSFPDSSTKSYKVLSDRTGYSKQKFLIKYVPRGYRETIGIGVSYLNKTQIDTRFAVQNGK